MTPAARTKRAMPPRKCGRQLLSIAPCSQMPRRFRSVQDAADEVASSGLSIAPGQAMFFRVSALLLALSILAPAPASAQYFGRNKVQYKKLNFQILKTEHFDIYFYPEEREGIDIAARMAERWHARLERVLGHQL